MSSVVKRRNASVVVILAAVVVLMWTTGAEADGYTARQEQVIALICDACARYGVDCTLPLAIARRESGFGADIESKTDRDWAGRPLSIGVFQWHAFGLGGYRGPGYWDDWRWDIWRDVDRGVMLITSHLRGGPSYLRHWWTPRGLDTRDLPACASAWRDDSDDSDESAAGRYGHTSPTGGGDDQGGMPPAGGDPPHPLRGGVQ